MTLWTVTLGWALRAGPRPRSHLSIAQPRGGRTQGPIVSPRTAWHSASGRSLGQSLGRALPTPRPPLSLCKTAGEGVSTEAPLRPSSSDPDRLRAIVTCQGKKHLL